MTKNTADGSQIQAQTIILHLFRIDLSDAEERCGFFVVNQEANPILCQFKNGLICESIQL